MNWLVGTFRTLTTNACPSSPAVAVMATILTRKVLVLKAVQQLSVGLSIDCLSLALEIFCRLVKDTCQLPVDIGTCQDFVMNWYFDTASKRCHQFNYGGCGGNENRFQTEAECEGHCRKKEQPHLSPRPDENRTDERRPTEAPRETSRPQMGRQKEVCLLPYKQGSCSEHHTRFYYDRGYGICFRFPYSGCDGNENNFETLEECEEFCNDAAGMCELAPLYGRCNETTRKWYFDAYIGECQEFIFSGCYGNKNNFDDKRSCENACLHDDENRREDPKEETRTNPPQNDTGSRVVMLL
jgi:papilin